VLKVIQKQQIEFKKQSQDNTYRRIKNRTDEKITDISIDIST